MKALLTILAACIVVKGVVPAIERNNLRRRAQDLQGVENDEGAGASLG